MLVSLRKLYGICIARGQFSYPRNTEYVLCHAPGKPRQPSSGHILAIAPQHGLSRRGRVGITTLNEQVAKPRGLQHVNDVVRGHLCGKCRRKGVRRSSLGRSHAQALRIKRVKEAGQHQFLGDEMKLLCTAYPTLSYHLSPDGGGLVTGTLEIADDVSYSVKIFVPVEYPDNEPVLFVE